MKHGVSPDTFPPRSHEAKRVSVVSPGAVASVAAALREAATWVGCDSVVVESVEQPELRRQLQAAVAG